MGQNLERRFERYGELIAAALAHADRRQPTQWYLKGLDTAWGTQERGTYCGTGATAERALGASVDASLGGGCGLE